jgi:hypothetical protein
MSKLMLRRTSHLLRQRTKRLAGCTLDEDPTSRGIRRPRGNTPGFIGLPGEGLRGCGKPAGTSRPGNKAIDLSRHAPGLSREWLSRKTRSTHDQGAKAQSDPQAKNVRC